MGKTYFKEIQHYLYEMYQEINEICINNNLPLFAVGGTLLGAVRYQDFIPWDDDMDFAMYRADVYKLEKILRNHPRYELKIPNFQKGMNVRFPKIYRKNSKFVTLDEVSAVDQRLFIDIFTIENVPNKKIERLFQGIGSNVLSVIGSYSFFSTDGKLLKANSKSNILYSLVYRLFFWRDYSDWNTYAYNFFGSCSDEKTTYITLPGGAKHYFGEIVLREIFGEGRQIPFRKGMIKVPENFHDYLVNRYGKDYIIPPNKENRYNHEAKEFSVDERRIF